MVEVIKIIKISKKGDFEILKVLNGDLCSFSNSAVVWGPQNCTNWGPPVVPDILYYKEDYKKNYNLHFVQLHKYMYT
jgi:hypothetical protein